MTLPVAEKYGDVQAGLMDVGTRAPEIDLLIAVTALGVNLNTVYSRLRASRRSFEAAMLLKTGVAR